MTPQSNETELIGNWIVKNVCERIIWLTSHHLRKLTLSKQGEPGKHFSKTQPMAVIGSGHTRIAQCMAVVLEGKYGKSI
jgi:hypothetical protein